MTEEKGVRARNDLLELLSNRIMVIDGAMGTMLQGYGLKAGEAPELWNVSYPDIVKKIHYSYLEAGADIILTNTFGANGIKLNKLGYSDKIIEFNKQAVKLAREVADDYEKTHLVPIFVAGSVGPTGEILEPYGPVKSEDTYTGYQEQIKVLASSGVDFILLETFYDINEISIALKVVKEVCDLPVFASMTFDEGLKTIYGVNPEKAIEVLFKEGADGVGANCGSGPETLYQIMSRMRAMTDAPLLVKPNAGIPYIENNRVVYPATPQEMAEYTEKFIKLKVNIIGGCCGTTPEHIRCIAEKIKNKNI